VKWRKLLVIKSQNTGENCQAVSNIIRYWNSELLCSPESSTSHADPDLAYLDNLIEKRVLSNILTCHVQQYQKRCLDIGAGYGRFAPTFLQFYEDIVLLEAAEKIYEQLLTLWQKSNAILCQLGTFESFDDEQKFDLIFASGVLYLYDDEMLYRFLTKSRSMLAQAGLLILRDFVSEPPKVTKSAYVEDGFCYYRSPEFWTNVAQVYTLDLLEVRRSKPHLGLLRNSRVLKILRLLRVKKWIRHDRVIGAAIRFGDWQLTGKGVQTVYLVMRAK
jgi:SAM-dependent methyltransferase